MHARRPCRSLALFVALLSIFLPAVSWAEVAGEVLWREADASLSRAASEREILPDRGRVARLDTAALESLLERVPLEILGEGADRSGGEILSLPLPEGGFERFLVVESPIMEPALAAKFPEIRTYRGQGVDDPSATVRFDRTPAGFHAAVRSPRGSYFIDPYSRVAPDHVVVYRPRELRRTDSFQCAVTEKVRHSTDGAPREAGRSGETLRTYRLAVAATGEYTAFHGGTVPAGQAAIVTAMNRVNGIYEEEAAIRMVLVANNDLLVYTNPATDPYSNDNGSAMLGQNQANVDAVIGSANYDIGHVFSTGGGGIASLGVPCRTGVKARGVTGLGAPVNDPFWVDFVAHEMGHQWAGNHTFNGSDGNCAGGNRNGPTAYEPGSGSTIQAYAGICGSQNLQSNSDDYFHGISLDEIVAYSTTGSGNNCPATSATGNQPPTVEAGSSFTIPLDTPFELCGSGSDPDVDPLTFTWEQFDLGPAGAPDSPVAGAPIFRSWPGTASPCRTFPRKTDLVAGTETIGELLPTYARTLTFRITARDNRSGGGGIADDSTTLTVSDAAGPFRVTSQSSPGSVAEGSAQSVTWDVAGTDQAPVSCSAVDIRLSEDGGFTFPTLLAAGVANDGAQSVNLPDEAVTAARVEVRCSDNVFFDISDVDFGIGIAEVSIVAPADGATVTEGDSVTFTGTASDPEDGNLSGSLEWSSSLDGALGSGASVQTSSLSLGTHVVTATATDSDMNAAAAQITVSVEPPCIVLLAAAGFEVGNEGWVDGASTCTTGTFVRGTPDEVQDGGVTTQPAGASAGSFAWFTANNGGGVGTDDVDGGTCETLSPVVNVGVGGFVTAFVDYFHGQRDEGDDAEDGFSIELIDADTAAVLETLVEIGDVTSQAQWASVWLQHADAPENVRLRVRATDGLADGDLIEAGVDEVRVCIGLPDDIFGDGFESGDTSAW